VPNPDQADSNGDGSGDACQPRLSLTGVVPDGAGNLVVHGRAADPQGETLRGTLGVLGGLYPPQVLGDVLAAPDCGNGLFPDGVPGEGIGYTFGAIGDPYLFDLDAILTCNDGLDDFVIALGTCLAPTSGFDSTLQLSGVQPPFNVCVRRFSDPSGGTEYEVEALDLDSITLRQAGRPLEMSVSFDNGVPGRVGIDSLSTGVHNLVLTVTDGNTRPVSASLDFTHGSEQALLLDLSGSPVAAASASAPIAECDGPGGGTVTLDGSGSSDPDSTPGTADDIASYEWYEDFGLASERLLGTGAVLVATLPLGQHSLALKVIDREGGTDTAVLEVAVVDTRPPALDCPASLPAVECTGAGGAYVGLTATAHDWCGGAVTLSNDHAPAGGGDASGPYLLGTTSVQFTARDARGNTATCSSSVTVQDTQPPTLNVLADPAVLWPPNHELVPVNTTWQTGDLCDPDGVRVELVSVTSSEPDDASGTSDGATSGDIQSADIGTSDPTVLLRAERLGTGPGRVYELDYRAIDRAGNATPAFGVVTVPHDQGQGPEPLLMRLEPTATGATAQHIYWPAVTGAVGYDVIRGTLGQVHLQSGVTMLGDVSVLARSTSQTSLSEPSNAPVPPVGQGYFYLIQQRTDRGGVGWGSEPAPWPREPTSCDGGCPLAENVPPPAGGDTRPSKR
jgi:hypothetical protein